MTTPHDHGVVVANDMPKCPRSAVFTPSRFRSARSVFDALNTANIDATEIQCLQRTMNGEVVVTFKSPAVKEKFLSLNSITINNESYAIQDIDRPLTFLTVYDAPFELSDWDIMKHLAPFCEVIHYRRGRFDYAPGVYNGLCHYHVRKIKPVPNFPRFGKYQVFLKYAGQPLMCRKCNCLVISVTPVSTKYVLTVRTLVIVVWPRRVIFARRMGMLVATAGTPGFLLLFTASLQMSLLP